MQKVAFNRRHDILRLVCHTRRVVPQGTWKLPKLKSSVASRLATTPGGNSRKASRQQASRYGIAANSATFGTRSRPN